MTDMTRIIADNLQRVRDRIALAAENAGRDASEVTLVGVTKYVGVEEVLALVAAGCPELGESRPQSLWEKAEALAGGANSSQGLPSATPITWHLIGHLQRNKARRTVAAVGAGLIHSVDSLRLLKAIDSAGRELAVETDAPDFRVAVLLEVNISGDVEKHGWTRDEAREAIGSLGDFAWLEVRGLMAMAGRDGGEAVARKNFAELRALRDELRSSAPSGVRLDELSMGMSGDLEAAVAEGATLVRVGSALFEGLRK